MPLSVLKEGEAKKEYLKNLFKTTYFKDILDHNSLKKSEVLDSLANIISEATGQLFNADKISKIYKNVTGGKIDKDTIENILITLLIHS